MFSYERSAQGPQLICYGIENKELRYYYSGASYSFFFPSKEENMPTKADSFEDSFDNCVINFVNKSMEDFFYYCLDHIVEDIDENTLIELFRKHQ